MMKFSKLDIAILVAALKRLIIESDGDPEKILTHSIPDDDLYDVVEQYEKAISGLGDEDQVKALCENFQKILEKLEAIFTEADE